MKKPIKTVAYLASGITLVLLLLFFLISAGVLNPAITKIINKVSTQQINGTVSIENIEGNLFRNFSLNNIKVEAQDSLLFNIASIDIEYDIWQLKNKSINIEHLIVNQAKLILIESADSLWNIQKLISDEENQANDSLPLGWNINFANIQILDFEAQIEPLDSLLGIPQYIHCNTALNFSFENNSMLLNMLSFAMHTKNPEFQVQGFNFAAALSDAVLHWNNLELKLPNSNINSSGVLPLNNPFLSQINLSASPLDFDDFTPWFSGIYGSPELNLKIMNDSGISNINIEAIRDKQKVNIKGTVKDYNTNPIYKLAIETDSLNFEDWTRKPEFKSNIKGTFEVEGEGFDLRENSMKAVAQFTDHDYQNINHEKVSLAFTKKQSNISANLSSDNIFGNLNAQFNVTDIFETPIYEGYLNMNHINLGTISSDKNFESDLNLELKAIGKGYKPGEMKSNVHLKLNNSTLFNEPIDDMFATIQIADDSYSIDGLVFNAPYLSANINGKGKLSDENSLKFNFKSNNLAPVLGVFGISPFYFDGAINGKVTGPIDALNLDADIVIIEFTMDSIVLRNTSANLKTQVSLKPDKIRSNNSSKIPYLTEISSQNICVKSRGHVGDLLFNSIALENIDFDIEKKHDLISGNITTKGQFGSVNMQFWAGNVFTIPKYSFNASLNHINLSKITANKALLSDLNFDIAAKGKGFDMDSLNFEVELKSSESELLGEILEDFESRIYYNKGYYSIEQLSFDTPFLLAQITGEGDVLSDNNLGFYLKITDLEKINSILKPLKIAFKGEISGKLNGTSDSLNIASTINVEHFQMDTIRIEKIMANGALKKRNSNYSGALSLQLNNSIIQDLELEKVQFTSNFTQSKSVNSFTYYASDSLQGKILTEILFNENPAIYFKEIALQFQNSLWEGGSDNTFIQFGKDSIEVNEMNISSNGSSFSADGIFAFNGQEDLNIEIQHMDLKGIPGIQVFSYPVSGEMNGSFALTGSAENPTIKGSANIINPVIGTFHFKQIASNYNYSHDKFSMSAFVDEDISRLISANLNLPYHLSFTEPVQMPSAETPIELNVIVNEFDINRINLFLPIKEANVEGVFNSNLQFRNTISNPMVSGNISVVNGGFSYDKLGMYYNDIKLNSRLSNNQFNIDSLSILAGKGNLKLNGLIEIDSLLGGELNYLDIKVNGKNFKMFDSEIATALINTNVSLKGSLEKPIFDGNITILKSSFNMDLFKKEYNKVYDNSELPMLIVARNATINKELSREVVNEKARKSSPDLYRNMKGQFDVALPKNSWIKGKNMNFELAGNIKVIKDVDALDFFGTLNVKRGYYKLYGKQLNFEEGSVTFTGGTSMNPLINFKIAYSFRDIENDLRKLKVNLSGRLMEPEVVFYMDDAVIEEKDAISYLIFSKNVNELNTRENSMVLNSNIDFAYGQLSNVIKDALQSKIGLDVIEIKGNNGWEQSTISTGKYLTNNLFLNYEHTFAFDKKDKIIEPDKVTLEYQFYRSLFLQATNQSTNSGFDFVLKWTWK